VGSDVSLALLATPPHEMRPFPLRLAVPPPSLTPTSTIGLPYSRALTPALELAYSSLGLTGFSPTRLERFFLCGFSQLL